MDLRIGFSWHATTLLPAVFPRWLTRNLSMTPPIPNSRFWIRIGRLFWDLRIGFGWSGYYPVPWFFKPRQEEQQNSLPRNSFLRSQQCYKISAKGNARSASTFPRSLRRREQHSLILSCSKNRISFCSKAPSRKLFFSLRVVSGRTS